jgi:hypothetical protein
MYSACKANALLLYVAPTLFSTAVLMLGVYLPPRLTDLLRQAAAVLGGN